MKICEREIDVGYYQRLRDLKEDSDKTQKEIAEIIGVSVNHYGKYERGETDIPLGKAVLLADYYNTSLDYIVGRTDIKNGINAELTNENVQFLNKYNQLSERNKGKIELFLDQLINQQKK